MKFRSLGVIAIGLVLMLVVAACSSDEETVIPTQAPSAAPTQAPSTGTTPAPTTAPAPTEVPGPKVNRVVMGIGSPEAESSSPNHLNSPAMWQLRPMYEYLIGLDPKSGEFVPQLATSWTLEAGPSFRFKLREGIQFHGGNGELTSADVVHTLEDLLKEDSAAAQADAFRNKELVVEVVNDHEIIFHLTGPDAAFIAEVSELQGGMEIQSKAHFDQVGTPGLDDQPIAGTGPYQFLDRTQQQFIRYERASDDHWRTTPDFPEFEYRLLDEASTRMAALLTDEVHLTNLPQDLSAEVEKRGCQVVKGEVVGLRTFITPACCFRNPETNEFPMFPDSPLMDVKVRKALNKAINRDELNEAFFQGKAENMILNHFHPTRLGWNPEWEARFDEEYGYDPAAAKALLAEAGYGPDNPLTTTLFPRDVGTFAGAEDVVESVAGYWSEIGVDAKLETIDFGTLIGRFRGFEYDNHWLITSSSSNQLQGFYVSNSGLRRPFGVGMKIPTTDVLLEPLLTEMDEAKQVGLWRTLGDVAYDLHLSTQLFWIPAEAVINTEFVSAYTFSGAISGTYTNPENIRAAR